MKYIWSMELHSELSAMDQIHFMNEGRNANKLLCSQTCVQQPLRSQMVNSLSIIAGILGRCKTVHFAIL